jgi:hypothetical protein
VDFDVVDEDALVSLLPLREGAFVSGSGNRYRSVLVPHAVMLLQALVDRLHRFAGEGGKVLFLDGPPAMISGSSARDARAAVPDDFVWAAQVAANLPATPTPPAYPPASAPEALQASSTVLDALVRDTPRSSLSTGTPNVALRFTRRMLKDANIFLLFNESDKPIESTLSLRVAGSHIETWDPQTGDTKLLASRATEGGRVLPLKLAPYATQVLVIY